MNTSLFEIFQIGLGPSSSHTVGPMRAAREFASRLEAGVERVVCHLYGSLALTGRGHATDRAVLLGLLGETPDGVDLDRIEELLQKRLWSVEIVWHPDEQMPEHPNGLRFEAGDLRQGYYSVGGGAIRREGEAPVRQPPAPLPHPYLCAEELLRISESRDLRLWQIALENERAWHSQAEIDAWLEAVWQTMQDCLGRGLRARGLLPGGLQVPRRAHALAARLEERGDAPLAALDWVSAWAMAVNEENAAGGRVVTAPTNGAAGILPAVAQYYLRFVPGAEWEGLRRYFLTAGLIGALYKENASISGADVGCQGEVGVAASMAAGGLVAAQNGSDRCVEKAAEIAMEHSLGMTCDPVGGLVQIPCIERNAVGAARAIQACRLALLEGGAHKVSLDRVIRAMLQTGRDMRSLYKETSLGGLAVTVRQRGEAPPHAPPSGRGPVHLPLC